MAFVDIPNKEYVDGKIDNIVVLSPNEPDSGQSKIWVKTTDDQVEIPTMEDLSDLSDGIQEELNKKTIKTRIDYNGTNFILNGAVLNYKQLHDIHLENPDFAFVVYGDRAYLLSYVQDDVGQMRELRFQSVIAATDSSNLSNVKVSGIYVTSSDGINIASVRVTDVNSENKAYKAVEINDGNKNSDVWYPTVGAVVDYSKREISKVSDKLDALWKLSEGIVYDFKQDDSDGDKTVIDGAKQAGVLSYGGKSIAWNSLSKFRSYPGWDVENAATIVANVNITEETYPVFLDVETNIVGHKYYIWVDNGTNANVTIYMDTIGYTQSFITGKNTKGSTVYTSSIKSRMYTVVRANTTSSIVSAGSRITVRAYDLTAMGMGDISSVDDPRIAWLERYAESHPEYNAGEIVSADVAGVTVRGADEIASAIRAIPFAIRQLDGYGWSAGSAYNSIEQTDDGKWLYHKRVGAVDLGKHNRVDKPSVAQGTMYRYVIDDIINTTNRMNMLCALYNTTSQGLRGELTVSGSARNVDFIDSRYDSVDAFKTANDGVMLYYELAEEVVTDVTDLMGDALAEFEVEAGGTITFDNSALLAVPNTVEYIRALKEVVS